MKYDVKYGAIAGLVMVLWLLMQYALGLHDQFFAIGQYLGFVGTGIAIFFVFLGIKKMAAEEHFSFKKGLAFAFNMSLYAASIYTLGQVWYHKKLNPSYEKMQIEEAKIALENKGASLAEIQAAVDNIHAYFKLEALIGFSMLGTMFWLSISGIVFALLLKKRKITPEI